MNRQKSFAQDVVGCLYLVPTPIGNLEDMTFRAVRTLAEVDIILAEDTRHTQKLLNHFDINTSQMSFHEHNTRERIPQVIEMMQSGKTFAQVSDAGTPSISDPGFELVQACIEQDVTVVPLPGANAGITALIASGLVPQPFYFYGFLGRQKRERKEQLELLKSRPETIIIYESPYRLKECFNQISEVYGPKQEVVLCRELTKKYEEFIRGTAEELVELVHEEDLKGECCILIGAKTAQSLQSIADNSDDEKLLALSIEEHVQHLIETDGLSQKDAIKKVAKDRSLRKQEVYSIIHQ